MNDEKKTEKTEKPKSTPTATLGEAAKLVPQSQLDDLRRIIEIHQKSEEKLRAELVAEKAIVAARDLVIKEKDRLLTEAEKTRDLAVQETCKEKSKQVVSAKLIESLKAEIDKTVLSLRKQCEKVKLAQAMASDYRKESAKLHARLTAEGIPLEPLSDEPVR